MLQGVYFEVFLSNTNLSTAFSANLEHSEAYLCTKININAGYKRNLPSRRMQASHAVKPLWQTSYWDKIKWTFCSNTFYIAQGHELS